MKIKLHHIEQVLTGKTNHTLCTHFTCFSLSLISLIYLWPTFTKIEWDLFWTTLHPFWKLHENWFYCFFINLLINRQTNKKNRLKRYTSPLQGAGWNNLKSWEMFISRAGYVYTIRFISSAAHKSFLYKVPKGKNLPAVQLGGLVQCPLRCGITPIMKYFCLPSFTKATEKLWRCVGPCRCLSLVFHY